MGITNSGRINAQILDAYIRKQIEPVYRRSILIGMLKSRGLITYGHDGKSINWTPQVARRSLEAGGASPGTITFNSSDVFETATLDWVNYSMGEKITKYEKLVGQSREHALYKIYETALKQMSKDFVDEFGVKLYGDGNDGTHQLAGFETCMSTSDTDADEPIGLPDDTYAGLDCTLGGLGGSWTGNFPAGTGDALYHAWSPLVVDYTSSLFNGDSDTWYEQWQEALGYLFTYMSKIQNSKPDVVMLDAGLLNEAKRSIVSTQKFEITQNSEITKLGHQTVSWEGIEIATEYGIPAGVGYALQWDNLELMSMQKQLVATATDVDIENSLDRIAMDFYGQLVMYAPSKMGKLADVTDTGS